MVARLLVARLTPRRPPATMGDAPPGRVRVACPGRDPGRRDAEHERSAHQVSIVDADQRPVPVARHALLISDNPSSLRPGASSPRRTAPLKSACAPATTRWNRIGRRGAGTRLPVDQIVDIVAGRDTTLELTAANAEVGPVTAEMEAATARRRRRSRRRLVAPRQMAGAASSRSGPNTIMPAASSSAARDWWRPAGPASPTRRPSRFSSRRPTR